MHNHDDSGAVETRVPQPASSVPHDSQPPGELAPAKSGHPAHRVRYVRHASQVPGIPAEAAATLERVSRRYVFRANDYYLKLIDRSAS